MSTWFVRHEGSPRAVEVPSAQRVLEGLRDGDWTARMHDVEELEKQILAEAARKQAAEEVAA